MARFLQLFVTLALCAAALAEVVFFEPCHSDSEDEPVLPGNCTINEVRVSPCAEAAEQKPCKIKRGKAAFISFDYTPEHGPASVTSQAYWASAVSDLPFVGMDTHACNYTTCPLTANQRQTYTYHLEISKKFPVRTYDVKWKLWNEQNQNIECCFIVKIKLLK